jgi:hypothetical protein
MEDAQQEGKPPETEILQGMKQYSDVLNRLDTAQGKYTSRTIPRTDRRVVVK